MLKSLPAELRLMVLENLPLKDLWSANPLEFIPSYSLLLC